MIYTTSKIQLPLWVLPRLTQLYNLSGDSSEVQIRVLVIEF